jgi:hypothetical protein
MHDNRKLLESKYNSLYVKFDPYGGVCYYCGATGSCFDHAPALSSVDSLGPRYFQKEPGQG